MNFGKGSEFKEHDIFRNGGIELVSVKGYESLCERHREIFDDFYINFSNAQSFKVKPLWVGHVEEVEYCVRDQDVHVLIGDKKYQIENDVLLVVGTEYYDLADDKRVLRELIGERKGAAKTPKRYLQFDYEQDGEKRLIHIISPTEWF